MGASVVFRKSLQDAIVAPIVCWVSLFGHCFVINAVMSVLDCFAIILMKKRELVAFNLLKLSS